MKWILRIAALSLMISSPALAQLKREWIASHDAGVFEHEYGLGLTSDATGNVYVTGSTEIGNSVDVFTAKFDRHGNALWDARYDGSAQSFDAGWTIALDPQGNVIVGGDTEGLGTSTDILVLKYDNDGNLLWEFSYDGEGHGFDAMQYTPSMLVDAFGNILITGISYQGALTGYDGITAKISPEGSLLWEYRFDGGDGLSDANYGIALDSAGNIGIGGDTIVQGVQSFLAVKLSPSGSLLWSEHYAIPGSTYVVAYGMEFDQNENFIVFGISNHPGSRQDYGLVKWNGDGEFQWARSYDGGYGLNDVPFSVAADSDGRIAVTGSSAGSFDDECATVVYDANGNTLFVDRYDGAGGWWGGASTGTQVAFDSHGRLFVAGWSYGGPPSSHDGHVVVYNKSGQRIVNERVDGPVHGWDGFFAMRFDSKGSLIATGTTMTQSGTLDALVVKYKSPFLAGQGNVFLR